MRLTALFGGSQTISAGRSADASLESSSLVSEVWPFPHMVADVFETTHADSTWTTAGGTATLARRCELSGKDSWRSRLRRWYNTQISATGTTMRVATRAQSNPASIETRSLSRSWSWPSRKAALPLMRSRDGGGDAVGESLPRGGGESLLRVGGGEAGGSLHCAYHRFWRAHTRSPQQADSHPLPPH